MRTVKVTIRPVFRRKCDCCLYLCIFVFCTSQVNTHVSISDYTQLRKNYVLVTSFPSQTARSLIECSQFCSPKVNCCGFNYHRTEKNCTCFFVMDVVSATFALKYDSVVYLQEKCETFIQISNISTAVITTNTPHSTTTTTITTTQIKSTTSSSVPYGSPCAADALLCLPDKIYLFSGNKLNTYNTANDLTKGPNSTMTLSTVFNGTNKAVAAFANATTIFIFTDSPYIVVKITEEDGKFDPSLKIKQVSIETDVRLYSKSTLLMRGYQTWSEHYGSVDIVAIDDVIYTSSQEEHVIDGDILYVVSKPGSIVTDRLDNNGSNNRYRSNNYQDRATNITAACELSSVIHAFVSNGTLFYFNFTSTLWTKIGRVVC